MERVKKTDRVVKTAESWWAFFFAEGSFGQSLLKWIWPVIGASVFGYAAKVSDWLAQFGPIGWVAAAGLGFALGSFSLNQIEGFRLRRSQRLSSGPLGVETTDEAGVIDNQTGDRIGIISSGDRTVGEALDRIFTLLGKFGKDSVESNAALSKELNDAKRQWSDWTSAHCRSQDQRFDNVDGGFQAIWHREMLGYMERRIEDAAGWLLSPRVGGKIENWGVWSHRKGEWELLLREWSALANKYREGTLERVETVPHHRLVGDWPEDDSLFPNTDAITAYRAASVMFDNFIGQRGLVHRVMESASFHSPSMKGRRLTSEDQ